MAKIVTSGMYSYFAARTAWREAQPQRQADELVGARVDLRFMSIGDLIRTAYKIKPHQIVMPDWMKAGAGPIQPR